MVNQFEFNLFGNNDVVESVPQPSATRRKTSGQSSAGATKRLLQRAVVRWLQEVDPPSGMALGASTRICRFRADVAAFWSQSIRNPHREGPARILQPRRSMIVQCFAEREECWPDCARAAELMPKLDACKTERARLERAIRESEPELRDGNVLFEEYAEWRYEDSANREYHRLHREILQLERSLLQGTEFERICSAEVADQLLLAVPAGVVQAEEMADGWGLLWVSDDLNVTVQKGPELRDCMPANRAHLVQNIAVAATSDVLFHAGLRPGKDGRVSLVQPPRGHRRSKTFHLT